MAKYDIRPLQLRILEIMKAVHEMCKEHGLRYYLADGSLIGAVREKGFIAWDDDMDICMPREDYEKFIAHADEWLPKPYELVCFDRDKNFPLHYGKIQDSSSTMIERPHMYYLGGVYMDVFPVDGAPKAMWKRKLWNRQYQFLRKMLYFSFRDPYKHGHGPSSWFPLFVRWIMPMPGWQRAVKRCMLKYRFEDCDYVSFNHNDGPGAMIPKEAMGEPTPIKFENVELWGLKDNHAYLSSLFGDYMTPPPPNKIKQHNYFHVDLNTPYREFDKSKLSKA